MIVELCEKAGWAREDLIRVYGGTREEFDLFCALLRRLAAGDCAAATLESLPGFIPVNGLSVTLRCAPTAVGARRIDPRTFDFVLDQTQWLDAAEKAEEVGQRLNISCFNWLTDLGDVPLLLSTTGKW